MQDFVHQQLVTAEELEQHCGEFVKLAEGFKGLTGYGSIPKPFLNKP